MTRRQRLEQAFGVYGITDPDRLESHIRGCDLTRPVISKMLRPRNRLQVWVRDGGNPGKYGAPLGEDPERLGIMIDGRHQQIFEVHTVLTVVLCTAATFPAGLAEQVGGQGGGLQYILPPGWLAKVERIS